MLTFDEVIALVASKPKSLLVAIDGLPLAGKTTLALRLIKEFDAECMGLDDFVRPEAEWPCRDRPSFPFDWIRYSELVTAVRHWHTTAAVSSIHTTGTRGISLVSQR
jgi:uridine kinase